MTKRGSREYMKLVKVDGADGTAAAKPDTAPSTAAVLVPILPPPDEYKEEQRKVWIEIVTKSGGQLTDSDRWVLDALVQAVMLHRKASAKVLEFGSVIKSPSGYPIQSPYVSDMNKQAALISRFSNDLGLTFSARQRGKSSKKPARGRSAFADIKELAVD